MPKIRLTKNTDLESLLKSDSEDENYSESAPIERSPRKNRLPAGGKPKKATKGRSRRDRYDYEDEDDIISDISSVEDSDMGSEEEDQTQLNQNGRPVRRAVATKPTTYAESDEEEIENSEDEDEAPRNSVKRRIGKGALPKSRIVTLKYSSQVLTQKEDSRMAKKASPPVPPRRSTRATSSGPQSNTRATIGGKGAMKSAGKAPGKTRRGASVEPLGLGMGTRRSSRLTGVEDEPMASLSNSGKHVVITGLKAPNASDIKEENESVVGSPKDESVIAESPMEEQPTILTPKDVEDAPASIDLEVRDGQGDIDAPHEADDEIEEIQAPPPAAQTMSRDDTGHEADEDDEDVMPTRRTRAKAAAIRRSVTSSPKSTRDPMSTEKPKDIDTSAARRLRHKSMRRANSHSDEDEYREDDENGSSDDSMSSGHQNSPIKQKEPKFIVPDEESDYGSGSRNTRNRGKRPLSGTSKRRHSTDDEAETQAELAEELQDLRPSPKRPRRTARVNRSNNEGSNAETRLRRRTAAVDYRVYRPEMAAVLDDGNGGTSTPSKRKTGGVLQPSKSLFDTHGPFGGGDVIPLFGRPGITEIAMDSDSSDDDAIRRTGRTGGLGGITGMTPVAGHPPGMLPPVGQTHNADPMQAGVPTNLGKITKKNTMADADPLGVASDITFDSVGGLDDRIQQLKEMVMLPLMYPEMFKVKGVTPPRGVLFHGPPGTGKTLMARAVASSFTGADGKKVTFFMRKGADCLSKWVGEAERQLRLLFDEARNSQPSIIFFDEIDGLAPVRSSKQEQIHASIVSTLLALMDGMDGRGQVVVIGATNRPDAVDPALRRPGRFDREFYFPLPATEARRKIIDIHTKGWEPPLDDKFKDKLAMQTKGYGGADLRALCTEAALNAMQRTYPQIYKSDAKLKVDPTTVNVTAKDFMVSIKKMIPSSERSSSSGASPLPDHIRPLLSEQFEYIKNCITTILPEVKRLSPLEEAEYEEDGDPEEGFEREMMMENFESARVFRPRLLIYGTQGLGQQYITAAVLHYLEKVHVQSFDLATLMSDATRTPETAVVQLFTEVKRHKPSVIVIPNIDVWYQTLPLTAIATFTGLLQTVTSNERIMLFGISERPIDKLDPRLTRELFGFSKRDRQELQRPTETARYDYFGQGIMSYVQKSPRDFPQDPTQRKKRKLPILEPASPPPKRVQTEEERRQQALRDRQIKNQIKLRLNNLMESLKQKYRRFKKPAVDHEIIFRQTAPPPPIDPDLVTSNVPPPSEPQRWRPYTDNDGVFHVEDTVLSKTYYNMDIDTIEERFSNGFYSTPRQFLVDLERIRHDARVIGEKENKRKANEMLTISEVYIAEIEMDTGFLAQCEDLATREAKKKAERLAEAEHKKNEREKAAAAASSPSPHANISGQSNGHMQLAPITIPETPQQPRSVQSNGIGSGGASGAVKLFAEPAVDTPRLPSDLIHPQSQADLIHPQSQAPSYPSSHYQTPQHMPSQMTQLEPGVGGTLIGHSRVTPMNLSVIVNNASTTDSTSKRTSDGTGNSHPFSHHSYSQRNLDYPDFGLFGQQIKGDSQLPATQVFPSSQSQSYPPSAPASQQLMTQHHLESSPASHPNPAHVFQLLPPPPPELILSHELMADAHDRLTKGTTGFSVEQLEQVNAALMDLVWKTKGNYNRDEVARQVLDVFDETVNDVREMQALLEASQSFD
ncbi:hypothetical protein EDC01DRAFT_628128 [Geopyxis carbonaria]|nr:hypothetical protein EDC01DRAFT_628128 [Geopyxis carbonaria]